MITLTRLYSLYNGKCYYCGCQTKLPVFIKGDQTPQTPDTASREHLIPRSKGGSNRRANIRLACRRCNLTRGVEHSSVEWYRIIKHEGIESYLKRRKQETAKANKVQKLKKKLRDIQHIKRYIQKHITDKDRVKNALKRLSYLVPEQKETLYVLEKTLCG